MGYIAARVQRRADAEDLCADVFEKAFRKRDAFDESKASISTWIFTITRNTVIDHFGIRVRPVYPDPEHFRIDVEVSVSPTFFSWVFEFAPGIRILGPEKVRRAYRRHLRRAAGT